MIKFTTLSKLTEALPRCSVIIGCGELHVIDKFRSDVARITPRRRGIVVNPGYSHAEKVIQALRVNQIPFEMGDSLFPMEDAIKILYDD